MDAHDVVAAVAALWAAGSVAVEASIAEWLASCWPDGMPSPADLPTKVGLTLTLTLTLAPDLILTVTLPDQGGAGADARGGGGPPAPRPPRALLPP